MRWIAVAALTAALVAGASAPVRACDPYWDWCGYDPYWDLPAYADPSPTWWWDEPVYEPSWSDPVVWSAPGSDVLGAWTPPAPEPMPAPVAAPDPETRRAELGLHLVTQVYARHTVTSQGGVTTYGTDTVAMDAGTGAKLVATVGTGQSSSFDADVLGGRMTLSDGRLVAGDIYENYVWNGYDYVVNAYVFFQDDSEIARSRLITTPQPIPASIPPVAVPTPVPVVPAAVVRTPVPVMTPTPAAVTPLTGDIPVAPITASPPTASSQPVPRAVRAGIALAAQADPLARVEVLRGRRVALWVRATVDGAPARVVAWQLLSGEVTTLGPISGGGDEPLVTTWRTISAPGVAFTIRLRASVEVPGEATREVEASIEVVVRSPALVE